MEFRVLGPLEVLDDAGESVDLGGRQPRLLLIMLLVAQGQPVAVESIIDAIWGETPPRTATGTLQSYVSRVRRALVGGPELTLDAAGYRLDVDPECVDFRRFEELADRGRRQLDSGEFELAAGTLDRAIDLWRGPALADLEYLDAGRGVVLRLRERQLGAIEDRARALLELSEHGWVAVELPELIVANPLREELPRLLALAQYRSGRQAEALRTLAAASATLREELGIEPGRPLVDLEAAILAQDPALDAPSRGRIRSGATDGAAAPRASDPAGPGGDDANGSIGSSGSNGPSWSNARPTVGTGDQNAGTFEGAPLVGRVAQLSELVDALDESSTRSRFVVIEGEPGIGKTRLADEVRLIAERRGVPVVWGRADEGGAAPALWPWLEPLRRAVQLTDEVPDAVASLLAGDARYTPGGSAAVRFELFDAVRGTLESVSTSSSMVILLDDLQWADETSLEQLGFLAANLGGRILVVATMRSVEVGRAEALSQALTAMARRQGSRRLRLGGLSREEIAELVRSTGGIVSDHTAHAIHVRAEGNPFFAMELGRLVGDDVDDSRVVPATVGEVISQRLARLPPDTRELLGVAAVTGRELAIDLVAAADGSTTESCLERLEPAIQQHVLTEVPERPYQWRFSHALVREVVLAQLTPLRRARLHLGVADAMEARGAGADDAEILAEHLWRAAIIGVGGRAATALERAADVAIGRTAYSTAEILLTRAVELRRAAGSTEDERRAELRTISRLLDVIRALRYYQGADPMLVERARRLAVDLGEHDLLVTLLWFAYAGLSTSCRIAESAVVAEQIVALTEHDERAEHRSLGMQVTAVLHWHRGEMHEAVRLVDLAMEELAAAPAPTDPHGAEQIVVTGSFWALYHGLHGDRDVDTMVEDFDRLIAAAPNKAAVTAIACFAANNPATCGRWDLVDRFCRIAGDSDPLAQYAFFSGQLKMFRGLLDVRAGDIDRGVRSFDAGKQQYTDIGGRSSLTVMQANLAMMLCDHGRGAEAESRLRDARAEFEAYREMWDLPVLLVAEGRLAHAAGDGVAAALHLEQAEQVSIEQGAHLLADRARDVIVELGLARA